MAPKTINYSNTIIYKLEHQDNEDLVYVGSTTDFIRRKCDHKKCCNNPNSKAYNRKVYQIIRDNGGWSAFNMVELKKFPCNDANEAFAEEENFRKKLNATMNTNSAYTGLTKQDYEKQWRNDNPNYHKQWYDDNKDKKKDYDKQYYINNADKIRERKTQKITCECGAVVSKCNLAKHMDTGKHFHWLQNNIE